MKKLFLLASAAILFTTLFLTSCSKSDDPTTASPTSSDPRERFRANWSNAENSSDNGYASYPVTIADSSNSSFIMFKYIYGYHTSVGATFNGNSFTIPSQTIEGHNVSGSGVLSNSNRIAMTYLVRTTTSHYDTVRAVLTK